MVSGHPRRALPILLVGHVLNAVGNAVFIFGAFGMPSLGLTGAGLGTMLATWFAALCFWQMVQREHPSPGSTRPEFVRLVLEQALPSSLRQLSVALGFVALVWMIGLVSTPALAAANLVIQITLIAMLPGLGLGQVAGTLVGESVGRGRREEARRWGGDVACTALATLGVIGVPMLLAPDALIGCFSDDAEVVSLASYPLRLLGAAIAIDGAAIALAHGMIGAGYSRQVMQVGVVLQVVMLPAAYLAGPGLGFGLAGIWTVFVGIRVLQAAAFATQWRLGAWLEHALCSPARSDRNAKLRPMVVDASQDEPAPAGECTLAAALGREAHARR